MKSQTEVSNPNSLQFLWDVHGLRFLVITGGVLIVSVAIFTIAAFNSPHMTLERVFHKFMSNPEHRVPVQPLQAIHSAQATGPLRVNPANPRYFTDGSGRAILLVGSHAWYNLQDSGWSDPP